MPALIKIGHHLLPEHGSLSADDECHFLLNYTAHSNAAYSLDNAFIRNLKKKMDRKGKPEWPYKEWTIQQVAAALAAAIPNIVDLTTTTFIPIPPSKIRSNPLFDDRVSQILRLACPADADIREAIVCRDDHTPAHESNEHHRPAIDELMNNYIWIDNNRPLRPNTVLFDDLITAGNHFIACKRFVLEHQPATRAIGIFVARRALTPSPKPNLSPPG
jgi:predicted amidophosphoribosyltransferase